MICLFWKKNQLRAFLGFVRGRTGLSVSWWSNMIRIPTNSTPKEYLFAHDKARFRNLVVKVQPPRRHVNFLIKVTAAKIDQLESPHFIWVEFKNIRPKYKGCSNTLPFNFCTECGVPDGPTLLASMSRTKRPWSAGRAKAAFMELSLLISFRVRWASGASAESRDVSSMESVTCFRVIIFDEFAVINVEAEDWSEIVFLLVGYSNFEVS